MKKIILIVLAVAVAAVIFYNSARPAVVSQGMSGGVIVWLKATFGISLSQPVVRKLAHFMEYALLGGLTFGILRWKSVVLCGLYAVSDEVHQYFVPGRSCEVRDCIIDLCGVLTGVIIICLITAGIEKRKRIS